MAKINRNVPAIIEQDIKERLAIQLVVKRYTTNSLGQVLDDATVPADQRKAYPFFLFGNFDRAGGYSIGSVIVNNDNFNLVGMYVVGVGTPFFFPSPIANINNLLNKGDIYFIYTDNLSSPTYFHFVILSNTTASVASLFDQTHAPQLDDSGRWGIFKCLNIVYGWDVVAQLSQHFFVINYGCDATFKFDTISPKQYYYPGLKEGIDVIVIPITFIVNQYIGLASYIDWSSNHIDIIINLAI